MEADLLKSCFRRDVLDLELKTEEYAQGLFEILDVKKTKMLSGLELERLILEIGIDKKAAATLPTKDMMMKKVLKRSDFVKWFTTRQGN